MLEWGNWCGGRANAGPSTALRFAQDDNVFSGWELVRARATAVVRSGDLVRWEELMQVLRLRCASLRMTMLGGVSNC
jgi:hypothetical protein